MDDKSSQNTMEVQDTAYVSMSHLLLHCQCRQVTFCQSTQRRGSQAFKHAKHDLANKRATEREQPIKKGKQKGSASLFGGKMHA